MVRPVTISWAANGWTVQVGCQRFVFEDRDRLLHRLGEYLSQPEETEKQMTLWAQNAGHTLGQPLATAEPAPCLDPTAREAESTHCYPDSTGALR